jgi:hypothetical protein
VSNRLKAVITLLASDQPGEVQNAAAMLVRILKADGKDLHWLAGLAAGEKPSPSGGGHDRIFNDLMTALHKLQKAESELRKLRMELASASGLNAQLQHELSMIHRARQGPTGPETATQAHARAAANARQQNYTAQNPYWQSNPFGGQQQAKPNNWRDMATYAYKHGNWNACLSSDEVTFLLDIQSRKYRKIDELSYRQMTWLQDIYDRVRRVEASRKGR